MEDKTRTDLLLAEYLHLQKVVEDFDAKAVTIKAWSVTLSAAGLVTAYTQSRPMVLVVAGITALTFWIVEALWKANQQAYYPRLEKIEEAFRGENVTLKPLQITTSWNSDHASLREETSSKSLPAILSIWWQKRGILSRRAAGVLWVALWPHVFLPHLPVALCAFGFRIWAEPVTS